LETLRKKKKIKINSYRPNLGKIYGNSYKFVIKNLLNKIKENKSIENLYHGILDFNENRNFNHYSKLNPRILMKLLVIINNFIKKTLIKVSKIILKETTMKNRIFNDLHKTEVIPFTKEALEEISYMKLKFIELYLHLEYKRINS
jgi:hypothetical protein